MKNITLTFITAITLSACSQIPGEAYYDRGSPYSLLDSSSEVVNVAITSQASIDEMVQWIDQDQPTQAELYCMEGEAFCSQALQTLETFHVPVQFTSSAENNLVLTYDRVVARDCENRYIDNSINPYNLNHPTFGCSLSVNMVQMVGDKRQFTNPALLDFRDGERAAADYESYVNPNSATSQKSAQLESVKTSDAGNK